jgi:hypothetical protein
MEMVLPSLQRADVPVLPSVGIVELPVLACFTGAGFAGAAIAGAAVDAVDDGFVAAAVVPPLDMHDDM